MGMRVGTRGGFNRRGDLAELGLQRPHACDPVAAQEHLQEALDQHDGAATDLRSGRWGVRVSGGGGELGAVSKWHGAPAAASPSSAGCASWRGAWRAE